MNQESHLIFRDCAYKSDGTILKCQSECACWQPQKDCTQLLVKLKSRVGEKEPGQQFCIKQGREKFVMQGKRQLAQHHVVGRARVWFLQVFLMKEARSGGVFQCLANHFIADIFINYSTTSEHLSPRLPLNFT